MYHNINDGAIIIADAHYSLKNFQLLEFLQAIESKKILTTQLILLGDIFDLLFSQIKNSIKRNEKVISIINKLSEQIEVIYLEGNHDFNIAPIFKNVKVLQLQDQPLLCKYKNKNIFLAHGDWGVDLKYKLYTSIIRSPIVMKFLSFLNNTFNNIIIKKLDNYLDLKDDCKEFKGFEEYIKKRIISINTNEIDYFIEGHFHQGKSFKIDNLLYTNIDSFACNQSYYIVQLQPNSEILIQKNFKKESYAREKR
ncbi:MAG: UDP-2,3-diacylglucosamine hydrolase [Helicobacteraceae bacterium]|nr:UDP-2,3-diacylglucosamine hydrolase [Helicobacteraceae bacterium]